MSEPRELPDEGVVLRAGLMVEADLVRNALITQRLTGALGISVRGGVGISDLELMSKPRPLEHTQLRRSTAGKIRAAGFKIEPTGAEHHCTIYLPDVSEGTLKALVAVFDSPEPNPASPSFST